MPKKPKYQKICSYCRQPFLAVSPQAKYCSDGHRVMAWKLRKGVAPIDWSKENPFNKVVTPAQAELAVKRREYEEAKHHYDVLGNDVENHSEVRKLKEELNKIVKWTGKELLNLVQGYHLDNNTRKFRDKELKRQGHPIYNTNYYKTKPRILIDIKRILIEYLQNQINNKRNELLQALKPQEIIVNQKFEELQQLALGVSLEKQQQSGQILSGEDLLDMKFETYEFNTEFHNVFGNPSKNFVAMVHGNPGSGKSTFAIQFASYFNRHIGSCVYCSIEEGISYSLQQKIASNTKYGAFNISQDKSIKEIKKLNHHRLIVIDSVTTGGFTPEDIKTLVTGSDNTAFLLVFHNTKDGIYKGDSTFEHLVDINLTADKGTVTADGKHRFSDNIMTKSYTIFS